MKRLGLDIGSTTIKCVVLDEQNKIIYSSYERHLSRIAEKAGEHFRRIAEETGIDDMLVTVSGSAGMGLPSIWAWASSRRYSPQEQP